MRKFSKNQPALTHFYTESQTLQLKSQDKINNYEKYVCIGLFGL